MALEAALNATWIAVQLHEVNRIAKPVKLWTSDVPSCCRSWQSRRTINC